MNRIIVLTGAVLTMWLAAFAGAQSGFNVPGLAGTLFEGCDFTSPADETFYLRNVDHEWGRDHGYAWSARWAGFIEGPLSGEVTFNAVVTDGLRLKIGDSIVIDGFAKDSTRSGKAVMEKGKRVPVILEFISLRGKAELHLYWQWEGHPQTIVPQEALSHDLLESVDTSQTGWPGGNVVLPEIEAPPDQEHECVIKHVVVYDEPGRYAGWPSNGGFWMWGDEMAVAFECGWFEDKPDEMDGHARDKSRPNEDFVAHSTDGGLTWTHKKYDILSHSDNLLPCPGGVDFTHPDFALKCQGKRFYYSYDRTKTWNGPFKLNVSSLPGGDEKMDSRTVYLVNGKTDCLACFNVDHGNRNDLAFCARTSDGGKSFDFVGWISPEPAKVPKYERWFIFSSARLADNHLLGALQRKYNNREATIKRLNWIDVYESLDNGRSWRFLSKVADTDVVNSDFNGNPPNILKLADGRLCVTYGFRGKPFVMCAQFSSDKGKTWSKPVILRSGARNWDFGYPLSLQRPDGRVVTVYYFATPDNRDQFIAATFWDPSKVK
ncbi:MAG TPA: PA14 domain-containing protein [Sedimentisphaerales bacterium]|nr:PA14 domain-containing protein [Sedimentisphaerales bacterium]